MADNSGKSVAVVGLGACGLVTLKNLLEAGFNATGFDTNSYIGGLWEWSDDPNKTTVLKSTVANLSKHLACYTDFPYEDNIKNYATGSETAKYLNDYADQFGIRENIRLNTAIQQVSRGEKSWLLRTSDKDGQEPETLAFDKVVMCIGLQVQAPKMPTIAGLETFVGKATHSNGYNRATDYDGKRVVVVGLGNTGPDVAVDLIGHASHLWLSHRSSNAVFKRNDAKGRPGDHIFSLKLTKIGGLFNKWFPHFSQQMALVGMKRLQKQAFDLKPEWGLGEPQMPIRKVPTMNEHLIPALHAGKLRMKPALKSIDGSTLTFADGSKLESVDSIIFCTGFRSDFSFMASEVDPTRNTRKDWPNLPGANGRPLPRLYQGIFSLDFPDSLAFLGTSPLSFQACLNYDISSAAVAQIWAGKSALPSLQEMNENVDAQHEWVCSIARTGDLANTNLRNNWEWFKWCDEAAGIGLAKRMGYGLEGWKFWLQDRDLCKLVMDGIMSPHLFRLFDEGKRKPWLEARDVVEAVNGKVT